MKTHILIYVVAGLIFLGCVSMFIKADAQFTNPSSYLSINDNVFLLTVADRQETREQGLSGKTSLGENEGMLFVFETPDLHVFWMKDMKFAIDIIWLDEKYKIVHIEKAVSPETFPSVFGPTEKSKYVLETNAYFVDKNSLKVGDILNIYLKK